MSNPILIDGDSVLFMPTFGLATVMPQPGTLKGSGPGTYKGKNICVEGDEKNVSVPGCVYLTPTHPIPGTGTLKIDALGGDQKAAKTKTGSKAVLLKGGNFTAKFEVQSPAQQPNPSGPPMPDTTPNYSGMGMFSTTNVKFQGT
ncbi:MAG: hypothetical protein DM484_07050 [Candidatus Methylumidiphilus alinenensis]|uniref:Uncharacterized protein n=1 Tax=Candidatus Methylumidiphilus alinenensis TaxID=2202197 RepID=A0A2W4RDE9_9GAMM|nr:MAG: hypothetical protein DM484_07050 [Candidatus Methylumidiphilus alinenensis]